ncbi:hypothetical protein WICMUC_000267 [Wickerhamomyces mucosus]|uniref:Subtelomeric hrmA-associated cluster protein AFUB-079030/YDR124W-like helical bundle domain-containing protein n=1 Tax=Wickerhamomyces mucosus TaxID=1378264 RepID=A0A9P8TIY7_9ASCO|nr:hypothetical protein WICMUC_000267 [Wickerhamomyces mucosus]
MKSQSFNIDKYKEKFSLFLQELSTQQIKNISVTKYPNGEIVVHSNFDKISPDMLKELKASFGSLAGGNKTESKRIVDPRYLECSSIVLNSPNLIALDLSNTNNIKAHFRSCFREIQQLGCKLIAKVWIRTMEPKKQTNYPYKNGDLSKPRWWPFQVRHVEPDHLRKNERMSLLVSIVLQRGIDLEGFRSSTDMLRDLNDYQKKILREIYFITSLVQKGNIDQILSVSDFENKTDSSHSDYNFPKVSGLYECDRNQISKAIYDQGPRFNDDHELTAHLDDLVSPTLELISTNSNEMLRHKVAQSAQVISSNLQELSNIRNNEYHSSLLDFYNSPPQEYNKALHIHHPIDFS